MPGDKLVWRVDEDGQLREGSLSRERRTFLLRMLLVDTQNVRHLVQEVPDFVRVKQVRDVYQIEFESSE